MKPPLMDGVVERRLLVNYRVDPDVVARHLPKPFRPQLVDGSAVAGICLIRLGHLRPRGLPAALGLRSENAAHRIAVEWDTADGTERGVYIPRRDTAALANAVMGGRLYPGEHHRARFDVEESDRRLRIAFESRDATTYVDVTVDLAEELTTSRLFADLDEASAFFRQGSSGYSATYGGRRLDGLSLETDAWRIGAATVASTSSSFFDDPARFPPGSATLDCALVMRHVPVTWRALDALACA